MTLKISTLNIDDKIINVCAPGLCIQKEQDILDLIAVCGENNSNLIVLQADNFAPEFYDLKSGLAGTVFQKFSNYHVTAAFVGDFTNVSQRFRELIGECNRGNQIHFVADIRAAEEWLAGLNFPE
jgi:hypothetical protein